MYPLPGSPLPPTEIDLCRSCLEASNIPSLTEFAQGYFLMHKNSDYFLTDFHRQIEEELIKIVFKLSETNLIICMPPRFGKSELGIRIFLSWCFIFIPDCNFIVASNTLDLARSHVKAVRDVLMADWYREAFPYAARIKANENKTVKKALARSDFFETLEGGSVKGVGTGGLITGFGAGKKSDRFGGCIICDDLIKEQDFRSQTKRDSAYEWTISTIKARRNSSDTPIILIMQRLHEDDIVGRLQREEGRLWNILKVSAFDEAAQKSVWEETISTQSLLDMKNSDIDLDRYLFYAKYQQEPSSDFDAVIKPEWWQYYNTLPELYPVIYSRFITVDSASKTGAINDESVLQLWGFDGAGKNAYLLDMFVKRMEFPELISRTESFFKMHDTFINNKRPRGIYIEDKSSGTALAQVLKKREFP
jgi:hypothetical protein